MRDEVEELSRTQDMRNRSVSASHYVQDSAPYLLARFRKAVLNLCTMRLKAALEVAEQSAKEPSESGDILF